MLKIKTPGWDLGRWATVTLFVVLLLALGGIAVAQGPQMHELRVTKVVEWGGVEPDVTQQFTICLTVMTGTVGGGTGLSGIGHGAVLDETVGAEPQCHTFDHLGSTKIFGGLLPGEYRVTEQYPGEMWTVTGSGRTVVVGPNAPAHITVTNALKVAPAEVAKRDWMDPICAGWQERYTLMVTNTTQLELTDLELVDVLPPVSLDVLLDESSAGATYDAEAGTVSWTIASIAPGAAAKRELQVRLWSSAPPGVITNTLVLSSTALAEPVIAYENTTISRGVCPTATPTATATPRPTLTPTSTATPRPTDTPSGRMIAIPLIFRS